MVKSNGSSKQVQITWSWVSGEGWWKKSSKWKWHLRKIGNCPGKGEIKSVSSKDNPTIILDSHFRLDSGSNSPAITTYHCHSPCLPTRKPQNARVSVPLKCLHLSSTEASPVQPHCTQREREKEKRVTFRKAQKLSFCESWRTLDQIAAFLLPFQDRSPNLPSNQTENDPIDKVRPSLYLSKKWTFSVSTVEENVIFLFAISISQLTGICRDREF